MVFGRDRVNTSAAVADVFVTPKLFDRIVQSPHNLLAIDTAHAVDVVAQFRLLALRAPNIGLLRQIARTKSGNGRKVIFIGEQVHLPEGLDALTDRIAHTQESSGKPRLRDGRWVT